MKTLENTIIERTADTSLLSENQKKVWEILKNRKFKILKKVKGKGLKCDVCGKKSIVEDSLFMVVENEKKETKRISKGCSKKYFGISINENSGRINKCTL